MIRRLIREMLNELDRYERETGKKWDAGKELVDLEKMSTEEIAPGVPRYYFNMSSDFWKEVHGGERIDFAKKTTSAGKYKLVKHKSQGHIQNFTPMASVNPNAKYSTTPSGYYAYPLNVAYFKKLKSGNLPYLDDSKWVTVIEAADAVGLMFMKDKDEIYKQARRDAFKKYGLTYTTADDYDEIPQGVITTFTKLLMNEGFTWVYDPGYGIIHEAEPAQAVFLKTSAFKVIDRFRKKDIVQDLSKEDWEYMGILDGEDEPWDGIGELIKTIPAITDVQRLRQLSKHANITVKYAIATNPHTPVELFEDICSKFQSIRYQLSTEFGIYNAHPRMPALGDEKIKALLKYLDSAMIIVRNTRNPEFLKIVAKKLGNSSLAILFELARNPATDESIWKIMAESPVIDTSLAVNHFYGKSAEVICTLLNNSVVNKDEEGHFMYAKQIYARDAVKHNKNDVLDALLSDPNKKVAEQTRAIIDEFRKHSAK